MTIKLVWHDCFVIETAECAIVFDYWLDERGEEREFPGFLDTLNPAKPLYIFVSHGHKDHFTRSIFSWASRFDRVHYFLSADVYARSRHVFSRRSVYKGPKVNPDHVTRMLPGEEWSDGLLAVRAFDSTDTGVAYLVEIDGKRIFHAGDLNAWIFRELWKPEDEEREMKRFNAIIADIEKYVGDKKIDVAMFPVDSRIGEAYMDGARIFAEQLHPEIFLSMHLDLGDQSDRGRRRIDADAFCKKASENSATQFKLLDSGYLIQI